MGTSTDTFHEVLFPDDISYGSSGGPAFSTTVIALSSGYEQRNINWSEAKAAYEVSYGVKTRDQMDELIDFFYARNGKAYGFRYKDWADYQIGGLCGVMTGARTFQLIKRYEPATDYFYDRVIRKPVPGTFTGWQVGPCPTDPTFQPFTLPDDGVSVDPVTGICGFTNANPPPAGCPISVSYGEFNVPVRFDIDEMKITQDAWETMSWPSIPLVELRLR